nr:Chain P, Formin-1 [Mus musculus]
PPPLIPPPP